MKRKDTDSAPCESNHKSQKPNDTKDTNKDTMSESCCHKEECHKEEETSSHSHAHHDHDHKHEDSKDSCTHDHDHHAHSHDHEDSKKEEAPHHEHSHDHDGDCSHCGPKVTSAEDVADVEMPEWKKKALESGGGDASAAPLGMNWDVEGSKAKETAHDHDHGHSHEHLEHPGKYEERPTAEFTGRDLEERAFTVGLGGPVGSGKTALMLALCRKLRDRMSVGAVTNDIFTREDGEFLTRRGALPTERISAVETGGCPHAAIREDISANLEACERLTANLEPLDIILLESGGDNLAANFSPELADYTLYVIDVSGGDKVPRKGGPGITQSDVLVINKTDLAEAVGASLEVMDRDSKRMRGNGPTVFAQARENLGLGVDDIVGHVLGAWSKATGKPIPP